MGSIKDQFDAYGDYGMTDFRDFGRFKTSNLAKTEGMYHHMQDIRVKASDAIGQLEDKIQAVEDDVISSSRSTHTQYNTIDSLPGNTFNGGVSDLLVRGMTLVNAVKNGDFEIEGSVSGLAEKWNRIGNFTGSIFSLDKTETYFGSQSQKIDENGNVNPIGLNQNFNNKFDISDKIFISGYVKTQGGSAQVTAGRNDTESSYYLKNILADSDWTEFSSIFTLTTNRNLKIGLWNISSVAWIDGVTTINLTATGLDAYLDSIGLTTDPQKEDWLLERVRGGYFEGIRNWENPSLTSVGKNLFDKNKAKYGEKIDYLNGNILVDSARFNSEFIKIKPSTNYHKTGGVHLAFYNSKKEYISGLASPISFTTPSSAQYIVFFGDIGTENNIMIEENKGQSLSVYEEYVSSELTAVGIFARLPNDVDDRFYIDNDRLYTEKNIEKYKLKDNDIAVLDTATYTNFDLIQIPKSVLDNFKGTISVANEIIITGFYDEVSDYGSDPSGVDYSFQVGGANINLAIPKETYPDLATAQADLAGTEIIYQLEQSIIIDLTAQLDGKGILQSYENGTLYMQSREQLVNILDNGNFSTGDLAGWTIGGADAPTVVDNKLILNRTGTIPFATQIKNFNANDKIYLYMKAITTETCNLAIAFGNNTDNYNGDLEVVTNDFFSGENEFSTIVNLGTNDTTESNNFTIYPTTSSVQIDIDEVIVINMTKLGIENVSESEMLETVRKGYFESEGLYVTADANMAGETTFEVPTNTVAVIENNTTDISKNSKLIASISEYLNILV